MERYKKILPVGILKTSISWYWLLKIPNKKVLDEHGLQDFPVGFHAIPHQASVTWSKTGKPEICHSYPRLIYVKVPYIIEFGSPDHYLICRMDSDDTGTPLTQKELDDIRDGILTPTSEGEMNGQ